jgi:putative ABC transport system ATP-binding protein
MISCEGLVRTYAAEIPVTAVDNVDMEVGIGDYVALVGPSGSGKSTLLNMFGLLDRPSSGSLALNGTDVTKFSERKRARLRAEKIGFVFQGVHLIAHRTAVENVTIGLVYGPAMRGSERTHRAMEALESVGLGNRSAALPGQLSGGQSQRVAIARALVNDPELLICDEPTGNLDSTSTESVLDLLEAIRSRYRLSVIVATHDSLVSARASRVVELIDGHAYESSPGSPPRGALP